MIPVCLSEEDQRNLGFMPLRDDFERDYDNDAESLLARVGFSCHPGSPHDDDQLDHALSVAHVGIYNQRLIERLKRKRIAREHGLISDIMAQVLNKRIKKNTNSSSNQKQPSQKSITNCANGLRKLGTRDANPATLTRNKQSSVSVHYRKSPKKEKWPSLNPDQERLVNFYSGYNCFGINENLKPLMRYFNAFTGKQFLDNLHQEEILKHEIIYLMDCRKKGKTEFTERRPRIPQFKSSVYVPANKRDDLEDGEKGVVKLESKSNSVTRANQIVRKARRHYRGHSGFFNNREKRRRVKKANTPTSESNSDEIATSVMDIAQKKQRKSRLKILIGGSHIATVAKKTRSKNMRSRC
ncbi:Transcriptional adapter 2-beta [Cichlidogyrus casuarinus]|uniref:Transcriptional adapter 2-beta n=1 Tax=Cichlidogyrus casuarinus TaxID=1844966 RepID=A0ABD2Q5W8_9PLAT